MNNLETAAKELNGKVWIKGDMNRVYLPVDFKKRGQQTAYLQFDEVLEDGQYDNVMDAASLKVFTNVDSQSKLWNVHASKQLKHKIMTKIAELTGDKVCETWQEIVL